MSDTSAPTWTPINQLLFNAGSPPGSSTLANLVNNLEICGYGQFCQVHTATGGVEVPSDEWTPVQLGTATDGLGSDIQGMYTLNPTSSVYNADLTPPEVVCLLGGLYIVQMMASWDGTNGTGVRRCKVAVIPSGGGSPIYSAFDDRDAAVTGDYFAQSSFAGIVVGGGTGAYPTVYQDSGSTLSCTVQFQVAHINMAS